MSLRFRGKLKDVVKLLSRATLFANPFSNYRDNFGKNPLNTFVTC